MVQWRAGSRIASLAIACLCVALLAEAGAQGTGQVKRLEVELERTERLLDHARAEFEGVRNTLARNLWAQASDLQRDAWRAFNEGTGVQIDPVRLREAHQLTQQARKLLVKAIEAAAIEKRSRESVRQTIERAQAKLAELLASVGDSGHPLATQLLEQGAQQLRRAREAFQRGDPQAARLATLALELLERAARVISGGGPTVEAVAVAIERTAALLADVEAQLAGDGAGAAIARLDEARRLLARAREALRAGRTSIALRFALEAREHGLQILNDVKRALDGDELRATLADLELLYDHLAGEIGAEGAEPARTLLAKAGRQLRDARRLLAAGELAQALARLAAAEALLREAAEATAQG